MNIDWKKVLDDVVTHFSADVGMLHYLDQKDNCLHAISFTGDLPPHLVAATNIIPLGKGIAGTSAQRKTAVAIKNLSGETPEFVKPGAKNIELGGMMCTPIFKETDNDNEVVGVISIGCYKERQFTEEEIRQMRKMMEKMSHQLQQEAKKMRS